MLCGVEEGGQLGTWQRAARQEMSIVMVPGGLGVESGRYVVSRVMRRKR